MTLKLEYLVLGKKNRKGTWRKVTGAGEKSRKWAGRGGGGGGKGQATERDENRVCTYLSLLTERRREKREKKANKKEERKKMQSIEFNRSAGREGCGEGWSVDDKSTTGFLAVASRGPIGQLINHDALRK